MTTETRDVVVVGADSAYRLAPVTTPDEWYDVARTGDRGTGATGGQRDSRTRPLTGGDTDADRTRGTTIDVTAVTDRPALAALRRDAPPRSNVSTDATTRCHV